MTETHHILCIEVQAPANHPHGLHIIHLGCLYELLLCLEHWTRHQKLCNVQQKKNTQISYILTHLNIVKGVKVVLTQVLFLVVKEQVAKFLQVFPFALLWNIQVVPLETMLLNHRPQSPLHRQRLCFLVYKRQALFS